MLAEFGEKLGEDMRNRLNTALLATKDAIAQKNVDLASQKANELEAVLREAGAAIYSQSPEAPSAGPYAYTPKPDTSGAGGAAKPSGSGSRGRVVDADYTENS